MERLPQKQATSFKRVHGEMKMITILAFCFHFEKLQEEQESEHKMSEIRVQIILVHVSRHHSRINIEKQL